MSANGSQLLRRAVAIGGRRSWRVVLVVTGNRRLEHPAERGEQQDQRTNDRQHQIEDHTLPSLDIPTKTTMASLAAVVVDSNGVRQDVIDHVDDWRRSLLNDYPFNDRLMLGGMTVNQRDAEYIVEFLRDERRRAC